MHGPGLILPGLPLPIGVRRRVVNGPTDPFFANVVFLWEADGTDGNGGPWTAATGQTITSAGGTLENDHPPAGATCSLKPSGVGGATVPDSANWDLSDANSDEFTIECSIYQTDIQDWWPLHQWPGGADRGWKCRTAAGLAHFAFTTDGSTDQNVAISSVGNILVNTAYAMCWEKNASGKIRVYKNGTMIASETPANSAIFNSTSTLTVGPHATSQGWVGRIRITKGVARYDDDAGYTADALTGPFPTS